MGTKQSRARSSWLVIAAMLILCGVLGALQYAWIGEVSVAEQERLRENLRENLVRLSDAFNNEITRAVVSLVPPWPFNPDEVPEQEYAARYAELKSSGHRPELIAAFALVYPRDDAIVFKKYNAELGGFEAAEWPEAWKPLQAMLQARITSGPGFERRGPPPELGYVVEIPHILRGPGIPGLPPLARPRREIAWLIVELNSAYVRDKMLPEFISRYLGANGGLPYKVEVINRAKERIYPAEGAPLGSMVDASIDVFEVRFDQLFRRQGPPGIREGGRGRGLRGDGGRWEMRVRHQEGSLQAVVDRTRVRNLAVTAGILLLMLATVGALVRFTRRAQHLAELEMNFVAGVSHELRTPLTVIRTAAYNLRGKLAHNPAQVERYGALIQGESERLTDLVEEVLRFARAKSGQVLEKVQPVAVEQVIRDGIEASKAVVDAARCTIDTEIETGLPGIAGDATALKHALQNLLSNAAKYGAEGSYWIGVSAKPVRMNGGEGVEICVADKGPGIPEAEQASVFDPFYRGRRALQDQIPGTGLGLSLVKGIIEAHGGTISVESQAMTGTRFIIRIPASNVAEQQHECTDTTRRG